MENNNQQPHWKAVPVRPYTPLPPVNVAPAPPHAPLPPVNVAPAPPYAPLPLEMAAPPPPYAHLPLAMAAPSAGVHAPFAHQSPGIAASPSPFAHFRPENPNSPPPPHLVAPNQDLFWKNMKQHLDAFWRNQRQKVEQDNDSQVGLPLKPIKRIMSADEDVQMISAETPVLFAKACELFILELTLRSWLRTEAYRRTTLHKSDVAETVLTGNGPTGDFNIYDFLEHLFQNPTEIRAEDELPKIGPLMMAPPVVNVQRNKGHQENFDRRGSQGNLDGRENQGNLKERKTFDSINDIEMLLNEEDEGNLDGRGNQENIDGWANFDSWEELYLLVNEGDLDGRGNGGNLDGQG